MALQDLKDTFYQTIRDRIAVSNLARTLSLRGVQRPAVIVIENELPGASVDGIPFAETFCLRWPGFTASPAGLLKATCEIRFATDGSSGSAGMDRGRALAAMDEELRAAITAAPQNAPQLSATEAVAGAATETNTNTRIFWSGVTYGPVSMRGERMERTATVEVCGYE